MWPALVALSVVFLGSGCSEHEFEPPDRAARVERADARYSPALFDTVTWSDSVARLTEGNLVYAEDCRRCHGQLGRGDTDYARQRELTVPSLVEVDWDMAERDALRRRIFTGHASGMPVFGDGELTPRQIDAAAGYILEMLRPDVLEED